MNHAKHRALFFILFCMIYTSGSAQSQQVSSVISIQLGSGIAAGVRYPGNQLLGDTSRGIEADVSRKAVTSISYDVMIIPGFSIGSSVAAQRIHVSTVDSMNQLFEKGKVNRVYVGFRGMWHYGKNEKIDLYSGFKTGLLIFKTTSVDVGHDMESELEAENNRSRIAIGLIPIGARFLIHPQFGLNLETSIGSPAFISFGLNYRF